MCEPLNSVLAVETTVFLRPTCGVSPLNRNFYAEIDGGCSYWKQWGPLLRVRPVLLGVLSGGGGKRAEPRG
jgi:hypothetical protein